MRLLLYFSSELQNYKTYILRQNERHARVHPIAVSVFDVVDKTLFLRQTNPNFGISHLSLSSFTFLSFCLYCTCVDTYTAAFKSVYIWLNIVPIEKPVEKPTSEEENNASAHYSMRTFKGY